MKIKVKVSRWKHILVCQVCTKQITHAEKRNSSGVCPKCGHDSGRTINRSIKIVYKKYTYFKLLCIIPERTEYEGKDEFSINWLKKNKFKLKV